MKVVEINSFEDLSNVLSNLMSGKMGHRSQSNSEAEQGSDNNENKKEKQTLIEHLLSSVEKDFADKAKTKLEQLKSALQKDIDYHANILEMYCLGCNLKGYLKGERSLDQLLSSVNDSGVKERTEGRIRSSMAL